MNEVTPSSEAPEANTVVAEEHTVKTEQNASEILMSKLQSMKQKKVSFALHSQEERTKRSEIIQIEEKAPGNGIRRIVELTLEPTKMGILGKKTRLDRDEYLDAIGRMLQEEQDSWEELRMRDQIRLTRDYIMGETMIKHCIENNLITDITEQMKNNYSFKYGKRSDVDGQMIGESLTVILTQLEGVGYE